VGSDPARVRTHARHLRWLTTASDGLVDHQLTPAIVFFPSRRECDSAAHLLGTRAAPLEAERRERLREWTARIPQLADHPLLTILRRAGVAPHHAGHLTAWRMCVEEMLEAGLVRFVCATTTLAAGLDVPARTVLLSTLHRNGPEGPEPLTPTEFHQMTGRAGRRGRDTLGIAVVETPDPGDAHEALALSAASPDPVRSAFAPSDAQVLNILARTSITGAEDLLRRSFAAYLRRPEIDEARTRLAEVPPDPLVERPCDQRLPTRRRFEELLEQLRRARHRAEASPDIARLGEAILDMPCTGCPVVDRCLASLRDLALMERERRTLERQVALLEDREIIQFRLRAGILQELGYLDSGWHLTSRGVAASRIRHPRMLVLAEALRTGQFPTTPPALAAVGGALGTERVTRASHRHRRSGDYRTPYRRTARSSDQGIDVPGAARAALGSIRKIVVRLNGLLREAGLPIDPLEGDFQGEDHGPAPALWRAAVTAAWAGGREWNAVTDRYGIADGDLQRLIWQAAEILAQIEDLPEDPSSAAARTARETLLRPPVT
jgi:superfamily II RNA helicase